MIIDFHQVRKIRLKSSVLKYRLYYEHIIHFEDPWETTQRKRYLLFRSAEIECGFLSDIEGMVFWSEQTRLFCKNKHCQN